MTQYLFEGDGENPEDRGVLRPQGLPHLDVVPLLQRKQEETTEQRIPKGHRLIMHQQLDVTK